MVLWTFFFLTVPKVHMDLGKRELRYAAVFSWNRLQDDLHLSELVPLNTFLIFLNDLESGLL